jgi:hypothetical protein
MADDGQAITRHPSTSCCSGNGLCRARPHDPKGMREDRGAHRAVPAPVSPRRGRVLAGDRGARPAPSRRDRLDLGPWPGSDPRPDATAAAHPGEGPARHDRGAWLGTLSERVFSWLHPQRLTQLLDARRNRGRPHDVLTVDTASLVGRYHDRIRLSAINSGATLFPGHPRAGRSPSPRSRTTRTPSGGGTAPRTPRSPSWPSSAVCRISPIMSSACCAVSGRWSSPSWGRAGVANNGVTASLCRGS